MKKSFLLYLIITILLLHSRPCLYAQYRIIKVIGYVYDKANGLPVYNATVTLFNGDNTKVIGTNIRGKFSFDSVIVKGNISVKVDLTNYTTYTSQIYSANNNNVFDVGSIALSKVITTLASKEYITNNITSYQMLPTEGAKELIYTLNPELRNVDSIKDNYRLKLPDFPKIDRDKEKEFNKEFNKNRRADNPDVSLYNGDLPTHLNKKLFSIRSIAAIDVKVKNSIADLSPPPRDGPEKFVFVIWKKDAYGKAVTQGPEVEGRFLVYYYGAYKEGDTSLYHKADDATYGYATMWNCSYKIIVIDKKLNREMNIGDDHIINPGIFFERHDLFTMLGIHLSWIKIPIQIFE